MYERTENPKIQPRRLAMENQRRIDEAIPPRKRRLHFSALRATKERAPKMEVVMRMALMMIAGSSWMAYPIRGFMNMPCMNPMARRA